MPGTGQTEAEETPQIDPQTVVRFLTSPPWYFKDETRQERIGSWTVLRKAEVLSPIIIPMHDKLYRSQARQYLAIAGIKPESEIERLVENWYRAGLLTQ